ncbi:YfcC family protein [Acidaminobacter sp. JC074]|uniref:YfcC family protein n=1 Tax=Acidaminobacter sp. JC074 TaxID=2530199 RepID=UPI001F0E1B77|nr:Na+/H+ antiporter NhaC family protein [Acidaminobacter sp. JC074]MCH4890799.1 YfcC family protein [Acidaminobacter sp. JC074]
MNTDIGKRTFISAVIILFVLLLLAGLLTRLLPTGTYEYESVNGLVHIIPNSFQYVEFERLGIIDWLLAPILVLFTDGNTVVIAIILFLMIIGGAIHVMNHVHVLDSLIAKIVKRFKDRRKLLIAIVSFAFMALGAFVGIFEEVVPLVPMMIILSKALGYDDMMGLGMSVLAIGLGFAAGISNPFTIGVAQELSGLPIFSGALYRVFIFIITYLLLNLFLNRYGNKVYKKSSGDVSFEDVISKASLNLLTIVIICLFVLILITPFVPAVASLNLPIIALLFLVAGIGCGILSNMTVKETLNVFLKGAISMLPAVVLILLATGIKHIIQSGHVMDTILYEVSNWIMDKPDMLAILVIYMMVLCMNFFIGSGSAKAFIVMPIVAPLMDLLGMSRQLSVLAFQLGDGFSNILYPTNAVLLISLGLASVSYPNWFKWIIKLQLALMVLSICFLGLGLLINY